MITVTDVQEFMEKMAQRQRPVDPSKDPRLLPDAPEPPIKGAPTGPRGGCWKVNPQTGESEYHNPCVKK